MCKNPHPRAIFNILYFNSISRLPWAWHWASGYVIWKSHRLPTQRYIDLCAITLHWKDIAIEKSFFSKFCAFFDFMFAYIGRTMQHSKLNFWLWYFFADTYLHVNFEQILGHRLQILFDFTWNRRNILVLDFALCYLGSKTLLHSLREKNHAREKYISPNIA